MTTRFLGVVATALGGLVVLAEPAFAQGWTRTSAPMTSWSAVASSADGRKLVAVVFRDSQGRPGPIYTSENAGATWTMTSAPLNGWWCVASSGDGTKLAAGIFGGPIHTSVDSGATWMENDARSYLWSSIASSADGTKLAATTSQVPTSNPIFTFSLLGNPGLT